MTDAELKVLVRLARSLHLADELVPARPGDLVVEVTMLQTDPDAIGWLVAHGPAPYAREPLHVGDCPKVNADPADRTRCVCEHHDTPHLR